MMLFKEEAGGYPEKALQATAAGGETLYRKFAEWKPAEYDAEGELEEYGELKFRRLASVELFNQKYSKPKQPAGRRSESIRWDFDFSDDSLRPTLGDFVSIPPTDYDFWDQCHIDAYVAVPDLMSDAVNIEDTLDDALSFVDGGYFDQDWDQISDEHEFEKMFADGLGAAGLTVDVDESGLGVLELSTKHGQKARLTFK